MKFINKLKRKLVHICGGFMPEEMCTNKKFEVIHTNYQIMPFKFSYRYFLGTPKDFIEEEAAKAFTKYILERHLYHVETINSLETPELLKSSYVFYIACPPVE